MELIIKVWGIFFLVIIFFTGFISYDNYFNTKIIDDELKSHLNSIANAKSNEISAFLTERKNDLEYLAVSQDVIDTFLNSQSQVSEQMNNKLNFYTSTNDYLDLVLIDMSGKVIWSASDLDIVGLDLNNKNNEDTKLFDIYDKVKHDFGVGIFDPGYYGDEDVLSVFVTTPVLIDSKTIGGKKDMIGIMALQIDNSFIEENIINPKNILADTNIYLVGRDGTPITTLYSNKDSSVIKNIDDKMYSDCFTNYNNYYTLLRGGKDRGVPSSGEYINYNNLEIFGAHNYILQTNWCLLVELEKKSYYESTNIRTDGYLNILILTVLTVLFGLIFTNYYKINGGKNK